MYLSKNTTTGRAANFSSRGSTPSENAGFASTPSCELGPIRIRVRVGARKALVGKPTVAPGGTSRRMVLALLAACAVSLGTRVQADSIVNSQHDLSARGPGPVRALSEQEVCIFCHTPHNAQPNAALWNRDFPRTHYRIYDSSTVDARLCQPPCPSKMCLSCHDGFIAQRNTVSRQELQ